MGASGLGCGAAVPTVGRDCPSLFQHAASRDRADARRGVRRGARGDGSHAPGASRGCVRGEGNTDVQAGSGYCRDGRSVDCAQRASRRLRAASACRSANRSGWGYPCRMERHCRRSSHRRRSESDGAIWHETGRHHRGRRSKHRPVLLRSRSGPCRSFLLASRSGDVVLGRGEATPRSLARDARPAAALGNPTTTDPRLRGVHVRSPGAVPFVSPRWRDSGPARRSD